MLTGTAVWGKADSYPWWPAVVFEEDDAEVPPAVLAAKPTGKAKKHATLVRFFDKRYSWCARADCVELAGS
jgi:hypothetical protein